MKRREDIALQKHTLNLFDGDYAKIQRFYPARIGAAKVIRDIIHAHVRKIEEDTAQKLVANLDLEHEFTIEEQLINE